MPRRRQLRISVDSLINAVYREEPIAEYRNLVHAALRLHIHRSQLHRYRRDGGIPISSADRFAALLNLHPSSIWDGWFDIDGWWVDVESPDGAGLAAAC